MINRAYTLEEEIVNTATHAVGAIICSFIFGILFYTCISPEHTCISKNIATCVFGISSILMFIISSLYHAITNIPLKRIMKMCDHIAIYFLIVCTYIPLSISAVVPTNPLIGWGFVIMQLCCLVGGISFKLLSQNKYSIISVLIYCCIGWSAIFIIMPIVHNLSAIALCWLISGCIAYTFGVPFYIAKQYKWTHSVWHVFVVLGVICHYLTMFNI